MQMCNNQMNHDPQIHKKEMDKLHTHTKKTGMGIVHACWVFSSTDMFTEGPHISQRT